MYKNNSLNGTTFEHEIESLLKKEKTQYLSQYTLSNSEERLDIMVKTQSGVIVNFSAKSSLRERYRLSAVENEHLKLNFKKVKTYIITKDTQRAIILTKQAIKRSPFLKRNIKDVIHINDLPALLNKLNLGKINSNSKKILNYVEHRSNT